MKKNHIIIIVFIIVAIGVIISLFTNSSTYSDFDTAARNPGKELHIIGQLDTLKPIIYDTEKDANSFSFYMKDKNGVEKQVIYKGAKPQDFEKSEQVVIIGKVENNGTFTASSLLLKCPSKYNEDKTPQQYENKEFKTQTDSL